MLEALTRSGYLLEAEIAKELTNLGFFVETNQVIQDPLTGKSREIDITAEYWRHDPKRSSKVSAKIEYIFEVKNNPFPLVLLNEFEFSPRVESWLGLREVITNPTNASYDGFHDFWEPLIEKRKNKIFCQYCSFQRKKQNDDLMALHPDVVHTGIAKIIQYSDECVEAWEDWQSEESDREDRFMRHWLFLPILLLNDDLYELRDDTLEKVDHSILLVNYHYKGEPRIAFVYVVTKKGFRRFVGCLMELQNTVLNRLFEFREKNA